jgi:3-hydroxyacyl-CoA dehydrogenase
MADETAAPGTVAIIGSGLIGRSWATAFAAAGWQVRLWDAAPGVAESALGKVAAGLADFAAHGLFDAQAIPDAMARASAPPSLAEALAGVDFVQESTSEVPEVKRQAASAIDAAAPPEAIICSSTSAIVASRFTEHLPHRARWLVGHPVNPPHLVPIVELCPAPWTDPDAVDRAQAIYQSIGQVPVRVLKETDGFILNRLQAALLREAFALVADGVCSPDDLDKTIKDGLGLRWSFMGPFETGELNAPGGLPDYGKRYGETLKRLSARPLSNAAFGPEQVAAVMAQWPGAQTPERVAEKTGWRDRRLTALKAHKRAEPDSPL